MTRPDLSDLRATDDNTVILPTAGGRVDLVSLLTVSAMSRGSRRDGAGADGNIMTVSGSGLVASTNSAVDGDGAADVTVTVSGSGSLAASSSAVSGDDALAGGIFVGGGIT